MQDDVKSRDKASREAEKRMISILQSGNASAILSIIDEIREKGFLSVLPEVFNLLQNAEDNEILGACTDLVNDLNQEASVPYVIAAIKDSSLKDIRHILVSSCWQSGLDYSPYMMLFADLLIREDYLVAIEAFTVIENHIGEIEDQEITNLLSKLQGASGKVSPDKKALLEELIATIKNY